MTHPQPRWQPALRGTLSRISPSLRPFRSPLLARQDGNSISQCQSPKLKIVLQHYATILEWQPTGASWEDGLGA